MKVKHGFWYWFWFSYIIFALCLIPGLVLITIFVDEINWILFFKIIIAIPFALWYGGNRLKNIKSKDKE